MRKTVLLFVLALLIPAAAQSQSGAPQNGTLSIREGRGIVQVDARGSMTGRVNGKIAITDPKPYDSKRPVVYGVDEDDLQERQDDALPGQESPLPSDRRAVPLPHPGPGDLPERDRARHGIIDGSGDPTANVFYDGVWSLNDSPYQSLPDTRNEFRPGPTGHAIAARSGILKGRCP